MMKRRSNAEGRMSRASASRRASSEAASSSVVGGGRKSIVMRRECGSAGVVKEGTASKSAMHFVDDHVQAYSVLQEGEWDAERPRKQQRSEEREERWTGPARLEG